MSAACFVTGTGTEVGQDGGRRGDRPRREPPRASGFRSSSPPSAASTTTRSPRRPGRALRASRSRPAPPRGGIGAGRRRGRPLPLRAARLPAPRGRDRRRADRPGPCSAAPRWPPPRARTCSSAREWAASWSHSATDYLVRDLARDLGLPVVDRRLARPRDDQSHAAHDRGSPSGRPRGGRGRAQPVACRAIADGAVQPGAPSRRSARWRWRRCRTSTSPDPTSWPALHITVGATEGGDQPGPTATASGRRPGRRPRRRSPRHRAALSSAASCASTRLARAPRSSVSETASPATTTKAASSIALLERVDEGRARLLGRGRQLRRVEAAAELGLEDRAGGRDADRGADHARHLQHAGRDAGLLHADGVHRGGRHRRHHQGDADSHQDERERSARRRWCRCRPRRT